MLPPVTARAPWPAWRTAASVPAPVALAGAALALAALTLALPSTVTYDPWSWLVWGRELADGGLDTVGGPAWKPLPAGVAAVLAPLGDAAPYAWLLLARAGAILAVLLAARLAWRLAPAAARLPAALLAGTGTAVTGDMLWHAGVGNAEGLCLALGLLAADLLLDGRDGPALAAAAAATLVRVEAAPFLLVLAALVAHRRPSLRLPAAAAVVAVAALWLVPDRLGSGRWDRSADRARVLEPGAPGLADQPAPASLWAGMQQVAPLVAAGLVLAAVPAVRHRMPRAALALAGVAAGWMAVVALMAATGTSGEARYHLPAAALLAVPAGVAIAIALDRAGAPRAVLPVLLAALAVPALPSLADQTARLAHEARLYGSLDGAVAAAGGAAAVRACGPAGTGPLAKPALAWHLDLPLRRVAPRAVARGTVFSAQHVEGAPASPAAVPGPVPVAVHGPWTVLRRCA